MRLSQVIGLLVLAVALAAASPAIFAAPVAIPGSLTDPNQDLDGNGVNETEYSRISTTFTSGKSSEALTGQISFRYMFLTSESSASDDGRPEEAGFDAFIIRVRRVTSATASGNAQIRGAVDKPGGGYDGVFTQYDFENQQVNNVAEPNFIDDSFVFDAGGDGFTITHFAADGAIGWKTATLTFTLPSTNTQFIFEAIVADSGDKKFDSILLIDQVTLVSNGTTGTTSFTNGSFEAAGNHFSGWTREGETGVYSSVAALSGNPDHTINPTHGSFFAALGTGDVNYVPDEDIQPSIPEPTTLATLGLALLALASRRHPRRAH